MSDRDRDFACALAIAVEAHGEQADKQGEPYVLHVLRVALAGITREEQIVGALHDVMEDGGWREEDLHAEFGAEIAEAVWLLTRPKNSTMSYEEYIDRLRPWPLARAVKVNDLRDNLSRIEGLSSADRLRLEPRYRWAMDRLTAACPVTIETRP